MPKPSLGATRWATDETNNTAPTSGQRDTGWTANQTAVSSYFNALAKAYYDWFTYIDAGVWDDDLDITGNLTVGGNTTLGNAAGDTTTVAGPVTFTTGLGAHFPLGSYKFKFSEQRTVRYEFTLNDVVSCDQSVTRTAGYSGITIPQATNALYLRLPSFNENYRLKKVVVHVGNVNTGGSMTLCTGVWLDATPFQNVTGAVGIAEVAGTYTLTPSSPSTGAVSYIVKVVSNAVTGDMTIFGADIYLDSI